MTIDEAAACLRGPGGVTYDELDTIFRAFGFSSRSPNFETEVYYHPSYKDCGLFTARDDGYHLLTLSQRDLVLRMLQCVQLHRWADRRPPT